MLEFTAAAVGKRLVFPFRMADGRNGEKLGGLMRFWVYRLPQDAEIAVDVNGTVVEPARISRTAAGQRRGEIAGFRFEISLADCPPFRGDNELGLTLATETDQLRTAYMEELEVTVETPVPAPEPASDERQ